MRTLKKSLCLVLALIFVLGLCTVGSNAAFAQYTDLDKVTYEEAVEVLSGLGVIEGYPDGTFNPTANVTRAEAAAMIARMMLGRDKADRLPVGDVKFSDVPETNWAAKYIAFCANKGIIVGMGDGTFHPAENVTGTQMATMLLRALGYGVMGEYEGKGWDINAVSDALYYKVFEDSKVNDFSQAATREETALYCWNTMWIQLVGYDVDLNYYSGRTYRYEYVTDSGYRYWDTAPLTFAKEGFDLVKWNYAQIVANQATGEDYTIARLLTGYVAAKDADGKEIKGQVEPEYDVIYLDAETGLDLIGHEVTIYFKDTQIEDKVNHLDYYEIFFIKDESTVYSPGMTFASYDDMYRALKAANKDNVDVDFRDVEVWYNYDCDDVHAFGPVLDFNNFNYYYQVEGLKGQKSSYDLAWLFIGGTWILDHEGKILVVLEDNYLIGKVKSVDESHGEVEVDVWTPSSYYYMPEYERDEAGNLKFDFETNTYITKKNDDGEDIEDKSFKRIYAEDYYYVYGSGKKVLDEDDNVCESLTDIPDTYVTIPGIGRYSLLKEKDSSSFETEVFDMKKGDLDLVYDGIAKKDYVVVQPQGSLTFLKETYTEVADITERDYVTSWSYNNSAYSADSNYGIPVEDQDDPDEVGVGDEVKFYVVKGLFSTTYFALEILEKAKSEGIVYVNYKAEAVEIGDWDYVSDKESGKVTTGSISSAYKVQAITQDGDIVTYKMSKKDADAFDELAVGAVYEVFVRGKFASFEPYEKAVKITKQAGKNSYLKKDGNIYYVTSDTKVVYIKGEANDCKTTVSNKLAKGTYDVYAVVKKSGGNFKLSTVWVDDDTVKAPDNFGDSFMYIKADRGATTQAPVGYEDFDDDEDAYYTVYVDGVKVTHAHLVADEEDNCFVKNAVKAGFYQFNYDEDEGYYEIGPVDADEYVHTATLKKGYVDNGRLYAEGSDGVKITAEVVDISGGTTTKTKENTKINSVEVLEDMLNDGYTVTVTYMYSENSDGDEVPTGIMYVIRVVAP